MADSAEIEKGVAGFKRRFTDLLTEEQIARAEPLARELIEAHLEARAERRSGRWGKMPIWLFTCGLSVHALALYALLGARYARPNGTAFPSWHTLAADLNISKPTVGKALRELLAAGAVTKTRRRRADGAHVSNLYQLVYDDPGFDFKGVGGSIQ